MDWRLRRAEPGDAAFLSLVAGATFLEAYSSFIDRDDMMAHLTGKASPERFAGWIADDASIVTLAESPAGGAPLGYTVLTDPDLPVERQDGDVELLRIYTLATSWGAGLGNALIDRAIADAGERDARRMLLGVHPGNVRARRFYERKGFVVIGQRRFQVGKSVFEDPVYGRAL